MDLMYRVNHILTHIPSLFQVPGLGCSNVLTCLYLVSPLFRYEAACLLKETLRGRAALLLVDRTDIATAAEADGVLLSDQGGICLI